MLKVFDPRATAISNTKETFMVRKTSKSPSRLDKRKEFEAAEKLEAVESKTAKPDKKKAVRKASPKKKKKKKKLEHQRMRMTWGVFDNSNHQVAVFPYVERDKADSKAAAMTEKGRGPFFVQPVKEPITEPAEE